MQVSCSVIKSLIDLGEGNPSFWTHGCPQSLCHDYFLIEHISRNWNTREGLMDIYWVYLHCHLIIEAFLCSGWYLAIIHIDQKYLYMCLSQGATQIPSPQISLLPIFQWCSSPSPLPGKQYKPFSLVISESREGTKEYTAHIRSSRCFPLISV